MAITDMEKLQRFADEVMAEANAEAEEILEGVGKRREEMMERGKREVDAGCAEWLDSEMKAMRRKNAREYSRESTRLREQLLLGREAVADEVISRVKEKLMEFVAGEKYGAWLVELCVSVAATRDESFTIYLSDTDAARYKYDILRALDEYQESVAVSTTYTDKMTPVYSIVPDRTIKIGGARFLSGEGTVSVNETLDENLRIGKEMIGRLIGGAEK